MVLDIENHKGVSEFFEGFALEQRECYQPLSVQSIAQPVELYTSKPSEVLHSELEVSG